MYIKHLRYVGVVSCVMCVVDKLAKQNVLFFFLLPDLHRFHFDIVCNVNGIIHVFALIK